MIMATLGEIEQLTKAWADAQDSLVETVQGLEDAVESLKRQYLPALKRQVGIAAAKKAELKNAIEDSRDVFRRPKSLVIHGVQVGFAKAKDEVVVEDEDLTVALIEKLFPDSMDLYIKIKKSVKKRAVKDLSELEQKSIAVKVERPGEVVVIKSMDSQIKKYVDKLLKEKDEEDDIQEGAA
jgi:hypothetical protein